MIVVYCVCVCVCVCVQESFEKMWDQVQGVQKKVAPIISNATDGVNLICYSQGKCKLLCTYMIKSAVNRE